jgi:CDP-glucose 4,6-dehydratase
VLITGHTGFKGAWLALWLQALGARVTGLAGGAPSAPSLFDVAGVGEGMLTRNGDVRDADALASTVAAVRPEVVFHLAAQPLVRRSLRQPRDTYEINVMGTVNMLDATRRVAEVGAVVVVTSDKCYANPGRGEAQRPFVEEDPMGGSDPYSSSKGCAELAAAAFRASFFSEPSGTQLATARAGNVIGGGDWGEDRLIPDALRAVQSGVPIRLRNPEAVRPWQHVLNPLSGYLLLAEALCQQQGMDEGWNFGPAPQDARTVGWIAERLRELWPDELRWERDEGEHPPEAGFLSLDSAKARERLGWSPPWDLHAALVRTVEWHDAHRRGQNMRDVSLAQIQQFVAAGA